MRRFSENEAFKEAVKKFLCLFFCLSAVLWLISCRSSRSSDQGKLNVFGLTDQTQEAAELVEQANADLKKIRKMYKENQNKIEDLKSAMNEKRVEDVRKIADDLVYIINDGFVLGESAIAKISKAEEMNINETYREYLQKKKVSLQKQMEAFEFRRQFAMLLRDEFGTKDKFEVEKVKSEFRTREENFQTYMEKARELSGEANQLAKEAMQQASQN
jgi:hypothetical protein